MAKNFWGHVERGATDGRCHVLRLQGSRETEVCYLQNRIVAGRAEKNVLRLQVPVEDVLAVQHANACSDLCQELSGSLLNHFATLAQILREVSTSAELEDQVEMRGTLLEVPEAHNVRVRDAPEHLYLLPEL